MRYASSIVVFGFSQAQDDIFLLVCDSKQEFLAGKRVLPGGGVEDNETARQAAIRELQEETGLELDSSCLTPLPTFDDLNRDPRGRVVDSPFFVMLDLDNFEQEVVPGDDIAKCEWASLLTFDLSTLGFDHASIVGVAMHHFVALGPSYAIWPITFTLKDYLKLVNLFTYITEGVDE